MTPRLLTHSTFRGHHATTTPSRSAIASTPRRRHRHLPLRPLRRLPPRRSPARRRRTRLRRVRRRLRTSSSSDCKASSSVTNRCPSSFVSTSPDPMPTTCSTSCTNWQRPTPTPSTPPSRWPSPSPAAIRNATRTTAPPSSAARSPIPSRPAPPHASRSANDRVVTSDCHYNSASSARSPDDCKPSSANAPVSSTSSIICWP